MNYVDAPTQPEVWKPLPLGGAFYEISSHGRVRTVGQYSRFIRPKQLRGNNYVVRLVYRDERGVQHVVHRSLPKLVADNFLPPPRLPLIGFRNGDREDCWVENLYYKDYDYALGTKVQPGRGELRRLEERGMLLAQQAQWDNMSYAEQQQMMQKYLPPKGIKIKGPDEKRLSYYEGGPGEPVDSAYRVRPATSAATPQEIQKQTHTETPEDPPRWTRAQIDAIEKEGAMLAARFKEPVLAPAEQHWMYPALDALNELDRTLSNEGEK